jgi:hypothetical protein
MKSLGFKRGWEAEVKYDRRGLAVTTDSAAACGHLDDAVRAFLAHREDARQHLKSALASDTNLVIAHCFAGFTQLLLARSELFVEARRSLDAARRSLALRHGTAREYQLCEALAAWCRGEMEECASILDASLLENPLDALTFKLLHAVRFMLGDAAGMRQACERALPAWTTGVPERGFILGCHAFGLEETNEFTSAERVGRQAVELEPCDAWGLHAVAHVMEMCNRPRDGIEWLTAREDRLDRVNNFGYHLFWHRALFHLSLGEAATALDLYDQRVREVHTDDYRDIANAASLLWRLKADGVDVGKRWEELADIAERRVTDHALVFAQLHYILCLASANRIEPTMRMIAGMQREGRRATGTQARIAASVGRQMSEAIVAVRSGDFDRALRLMVPRRRELQRIGGSNAQRDLFSRILIDAGIAARRYGQALMLLAERSSEHPEDSWGKRRLARLFTRADLEGCPQVA